MVRDIMPIEAAFYIERLPTLTPILCSIICLYFYNRHATPTPSLNKKQVTPISPLPPPPQQLTNATS